MDADWFLKVIERSSINADLRLSFGDSSWNTSLTEENADVAKNGERSPHAEDETEAKSQENASANSDIDGQGDLEELSFAAESTAHSECKTVGPSCREYSLHDPDDDGDSESVTTNNDSESEEKVSGEESCMDECVLLDPQGCSTENQECYVGECSVTSGNYLVESSTAPTDSEDTVSEAPSSDDYETDDSKPGTARVQNTKEKVERYLSTGSSCGSVSDHADTSWEDSLEECLDDAAVDETGEETDDSLLDFAGELGVVGSDFSDSDLESSIEESFAAVCSSRLAVAGNAGDKQSHGSDGGKSSQEGTASMDSQFSATSLRNAKLRSAVVQQPCVESVHSFGPASVCSDKNSVTNIPSSPVSMTTPSKLNKTLLDHIPVGWKCDSTNLHLSGSDRDFPAQKQSTPLPLAPTQLMDLELSEAENSWLPPMAFTEEDSNRTPRPENKAVGVLLKECVQLRRSISDEYKIAEKVCVLSMDTSISTSDLDQQAPNDAKVQKMARKRAKVIAEIMETEKTYQHHLDMIVKYFEGPLRQNQILPDHTVVTIFSNIRQIIDINKELWQSLNVMNIGQAFLKMGPFLKLYSTYANNHERALATLMEWDQKSSDFSQFRREQEELAELLGLKLNALLITPVQRVPRYKLLLMELLENTSPNHEDYQAIQEACGQISAVATHINEHIKQQDNFIKMLAIQKSLSGASAPPLLVPGRMFVKEGALRKVSKNGTSSRERMFFLFSDILVYAKSKLMESGGHHSYVCCCILPLQHCSVTRVFGGSAERGGLFSISCKEESLLLYSDQKTVESWMQALTKTIGELLENRQSLRKISSAKQPLRKAALAKLKKEQRRLDSLSMSQRAAKRQSPEGLQDLSSDASCDSFHIKKSKVKGGFSSETPPRSSKVLSPLLDLNCLTPRSHSKKLARIKRHSKSRLGPPKDSNYTQVTSTRSSMQHPVDWDYSSVLQTPSDSLITGRENSPFRATLHDSDQYNWNTDRGSREVGSSRSSKAHHTGWEEALQTATQTARLFNPNPTTGYSGTYNNLCSIQ